MSQQESRVAVVTGGTRGIGLAVTRHLAERNHRVYLGARTKQAVSDTVERLRGQGLDVDGSTVDVTSNDSVRDFVKATVDRFGTVDVLVNNAGISGGGVTADLSDAVW